MVERCSFADRYVWPVVIVALSPLFLLLGYFKDLPTTPGASQ